MSTTISKDELRRPDHMTEVGQRFFLKLLQRQKVVLGVIIGLVVTGAAVVAWNKLALNRELTVQEQFYVVEKAYLKKKEAFEKAEVEAKDAAAKNDKKVSSVSGLPTGDFSKDYGTELQGWFQLIEANPSSKAAAMAALELSQLHLKYNQPKEAQNLLAKVKDHQNSDGISLLRHSSCQSRPVPGIRRNLGNSRKKEKDVVFS